MRKIYKFINFNIDYNGQNEHPIWHLEHVTVSNYYSTYWKEWGSLWTWRLR